PQSRRISRRKNMKNFVHSPKSRNDSRTLLRPRVLLRGVLTALLSSLTVGLLASENASRKPFAEWADLPAPNEFTIRLWYLESEAYHIWSNGHERNDITVNRSGEDYGIDYTEGIIAMEYGISKKWAADLNVAYGTVGTRSFNPGANSESTSGLLDTTFGVRYQVFRETDPDVPRPWVPTLTLRAGAIIQGTYDKDFPFAPGNHSAAIEPSVLMKKHFGWPGFGGYADLAYRWMRTSGDDQYLAAIGFFQEIKTWTINAGYRHLQQ